MEDAANIGPNCALGTIVTFLERALPAPDISTLAGAIAKCATDLTPTQYRQLVGRIGLQWHWVDVVRADDAALAARLVDPTKSFHRLTADGGTVGFFELTLLDRETVELEYLGLAPEAIGKGFGRTLLRSAITAAGATSARRLVARTCRLDHPAALRLYLKSGFRISGYQRDRVLPLTSAEITSFGR